MFERLAADPEMPWERTALFQVDERLAPDGDPARNWTQVGITLPLARLASAHPLPVTAADADAAASEYEALLPDRLDLVHLGLGPDGHTASLVRGDAVLDVRDRLLALTAGEYEGRRRMTLTYPALAAARRIVWLVLGGGRRAALDRLLTGDEAIPAGCVRSDLAVVVCDRAAAGAPQVA